VGKTIDIALFLTVTEAENWYFSRMGGQKLTRWFDDNIIEPLNPVREMLSGINMRSTSEKTGCCRA